LALAEELGRLIDAVGGNEYAYYLLPPLENIAAVEEATVRDKVTVSILIYFASFNILFFKGCCFPLSYC
jgi:hypothetical protein